MHVKVYLNVMRSTIIQFCLFIFSLVDGRYLFAIFGGKLLAAPVRRPTTAGISHNIGQLEQKWTNRGSSENGSDSSTALKDNPQMVQEAHKKRRKGATQLLRRFSNYRNTQGRGVIRTRYGFRSISPTRGRPIDSLASSIIGK